MTIYDPSFNYELINSIFRCKYGFDARSVFSDKTLRKDLTQAMTDHLNVMWNEVNHFLFEFEVGLEPGDLTEKLYEMLAIEIIAAPPGGLAITVKDYFV